MIKIKYTSLCHYPSLISNDCITLAVFFYIDILKEIRVEKIRNWKRVSTFNDELDIELLKIQIQDMEEELKLFIKDRNFKFEEYTKFYVNNIRFEPIQQIEIEESEKERFIKECKRQKLICDMEKSNRPSIDEQMKFIRQYLSDEKVLFNGKVEGHFDEDIKFDLKIGNYVFKKFVFKGKNPNRLIKTVKEWAYDAYKLKEKYKVIFVTDIEVEKKGDEYRILFKILNEESDKIINTNDFVNFVSNLIEKEKKEQLLM